MPRVNGYSPGAPMFSGKTAEAATLVGTSIPLRLIEETDGSTGCAPRASLLFISSLWRGVFLKNSNGPREARCSRNVPVRHIDVRHKRGPAGKRPFAP